MAQNIVCPKCQYIRKESDDPNIPEGQCPNCGIFYSKFKKKDQSQAVSDAKKIEQIKLKLKMEKELEKTDDKEDRKNRILNIAKKVVISIVLFYAMVFLIAQTGVSILFFAIAAYFVYLWWKKGGRVKWTFGKVLLAFMVVSSISSMIIVDTSDVKPEQPKIKKVKTRDDILKSAFSGWDGSHYDFVKLVKRSMNDPDSFEHVETRYGVNGDIVSLKMTFRGKNAFGGKVLNSMRAKADLHSGKVIKVYKNN